MNPRPIAVLCAACLMFAQRAGAEEQWFPFAPKPDPFTSDSATDLRFLNERFAGENGFITVKGGRFVHSKTGEPVRFWAVNGPPFDLRGDDLRKCARMLAKHGVNMVRIHGGYFDEKGEVDAARVAHALEIVEAMKAEGIYTHFSIYFPIWLTPKADNPWLPGYDGAKKPFGALFFNPEFQARIQEVVGGAPDCSQRCERQAFGGRASRRKPGNAK